MSATNVKPDSAVADLDKLARQARSSRARFEPVWFLNLAYYEGEQWLMWDGRQLHKPQLRPTFITSIDNRIQPAIRTELAKMTKNRPVFAVTPNTGENDDVDAAKVGELVLDNQWMALDLRRKLYRALEWSRITGAGFWKVYWDKTLGDGFQVLTGPDGEPITGPDGRAVRPDVIDPQQLSQALGVPVSAQSINQGDICVEVRSPFQLLPDPLAESLSECEWLIEESVKSVEYVRSRYNKDLKPDTEANPGLVQSRMGASLTGQQSGSYKGIKVREYWAKPSSKFKNGRRVVWADNQILAEDDQPFDCLPYVMFSGIGVPGRFWPTSIAEQLRGPQTELNKTKAQIAENAVRIGNPIPLISKQSNVDLKAFSTPGTPLMFDDLGQPNAVPSYLQAPQLPAYVVEQINRIEESIMEISGQHEVTGASVPSGVTAASAINLLQEADDTRLGPAITDMEATLGEAGTKILQLVARFYTDSRTMRITGDDDAYQIFDFRGEMLKNNTNVEVQAGSAFPRSKAAKQAAIMQALTLFVQNQIPMDMRNLAKVLRDLEVGGVERVLAQFSENESQVNRENHRLAQGQQLPINPWDDDQAHVDGHQEFERSPQFERLPPQLRANVEAHTQLHRDRLQQAQAPPPEQQQLQLQLAQANQQQQTQQAQAQQQLGHAQAQHEQQMRQQAEQHNLKQLVAAQNGGQ